MKTTLIMTIEHSKPIPDLTDIAANRVWPLDGVTGVTAAIQDDRDPYGFDMDPAMWSVIGPPQENALREPKPGFWSWLWRSQA